MIRPSSLVLALASLAIGSSQATIILVGDQLGNVGKWDTETNSGSFVGQITGSSQVVGLAFDPATNSAVVLDRNRPRVSLLDITTAGSSSFIPVSGFQGGAVVGGLLYGWVEGSQRLTSYNLSDGTPTGIFSAPASIGHVHSLGVDASTGQLYANSTEIYPLGADGTFGSEIVSSPFAEDLEYFNGDFLMARFSRSLDLMDGSTGVLSQFLNNVQLNSIGVTGSVSGVALVSETAPIPEPSSTLVTAALLGAAMMMRSRRNRIK